MASVKEKNGSSALLKRIFLIWIPTIIILDFILLPYIWMLLTSVKPVDEMFTKQVKYLPSRIVFDNYAKLLTETSFLKSMFNSFRVAGLTSAVSIFVSMLAAYVFARYKFTGSSIVMIGILLLYMFPTVLYVMPLYTMFKDLKLLGNIYSLILAYTTTTLPYGIWLLTGYIGSIPIELEEAARIDGASTWNCFLKIVFPLVTPGLIAAGSYIFITAWNEYLYAVMFTTSKNTTLSVMISSLIREFSISWDLLTAGGVLAVLPVALLFFAIQRQLVSGMVAGAIKG